MTYRLEVKNPCRCFMRDGGVELQTFSTPLEVQEEAQALLHRMEKNYCKKHQFVLSQVAGNYTITIKPRTV